ncbi:Tr-type G domain-containing protein [Mycena venus]|uniref:Eukaryotic translation initiation factor 5B n=1 Tax=Mycena venus TaxID=2733690 RepID=A0A8H6WYL5_9AGAR|nr:Tr-type G domain-containing protein [Mycena venus]
MPPKNKGKKGKKGVDDDEYWCGAIDPQFSVVSYSWQREKAGETVAPNVPVPDDPPTSKSKVSFAGFSALDMGADDGGAAPEEEDEDFGGLMSTLKATTKGKKDKKKAKKGAVNDDVNGADDPLSAEADADAAAVSKKPVEVTAEDLADEEWGPVKEKVKKGKKAKGKKAKAQDDSEDEAKVDETEPSPAPASASALAPAEAPAPKEADDDEDAPEEPGVKVLSKKEKEKLKKEREKVLLVLTNLFSFNAYLYRRKRRHKPLLKRRPLETLPTTHPLLLHQNLLRQSLPKLKRMKRREMKARRGGKADAKKKKKKKAKKDDEPAPAPPPPAATKKKGGINALKAMMEEKRRLEEEARRAAEEEQKRIEEEERLAAEAERKKEEEKQRRKEKEKAKRELAKKEGRLLTKKQKEEKAMAEIRKQALLASGVQIEGLQQASGSGAPAVKKVVYGNRKKKGPTAAKEASPAPESRPRTPEPVAPAETPAVEPKAEPEDDWEASSAEEETAPAPPGVKDSWDASSDEEDAPPPPPSVPVSTPAKPTPAKSTPTKPAAKPAPVPKKEPAQPNAKAAGSSKLAPAAGAKPTAAKASAPPAAESSESEDDSDDGSDESSESDSDEDSDSDDSSSEEELTSAQKMAAQRKAEAAARRAKAHEEAMAARSKDNLRSPICCILGHVDTGKTKLLDKIRQTNVQEGEAGGITQQIGATYFPVDAIKTKTAVLNKDGTAEYKIPGLLVIDTPGHESFTNLRSRGSSLCNIAILVVDIMHGLEPQTLESLRLLRDRKTPFIVALNKIDRMYGWDATPDGAFRESLAKQPRTVQREFEDRVSKIVVAFAEEGLNAVLYYDNKNFARNVSIVPTSAITGEGVPDMIMLLVNLTQQRMSDRLMYLSELECTVLEVKGDKIVVCGLNGSIVTQIRALLTPQPLRELRVKSNYVHHKEVKAALGVKISAPDLEKAIAGSRLLVCGPDDDEDDLREEVMSDLTSLLNNIDKSGRGVCVQASTLGSLEALLDFLKSSKIPVSGINIGPVHKKDVMRAGTMLEKAKELACILCFDVQVDKDAERLAEEMGIRLFKADIIYHLFDAFTAYNAEIVEAKRKDAAPQAVWPCRLKIIAAFCKRDPIILGVDILDGTLRIGTPIAVVKTDPTTNKKEIIDLGKITSLEINHKTHDLVKKSQAGAGVAVKIEHAVYQSAKMFGRHFDDKDELLSHITRQSVDVLKNSFRADVTPEEWVLIKHLKPRFNIQ